MYVRLSKAQFVHVMQPDPLPDLKRLPEPRLDHPAVLHQGHVPAAAHSLQVGLGGQSLHNGEVKTILGGSGHLAEGLEVVGRVGVPAVTGHLQGGWVQAVSLYRRWSHKYLTDTL